MLEYIFGVYYNLTTSFLQCGFLSSNLHVLAEMLAEFLKLTWTVAKKQLGFSQSILPTFFGSKEIKTDFWKAVLIKSTCWTNLFPQAATFETRMLSPEFCSAQELWRQVKNTPRQSLDEATSESNNYGESTYLSYLEQNLFLNKKNL